MFLLMIKTAENYIRTFTYLKKFYPFVEKIISITSNCLLTSLERYCQGKGVEYYSHCLTVYLDRYFKGAQVRDFLSLGFS
jgi:hypothetical protein